MTPASQPPVATTVDARGRACPLPIVDLARALRGLEAGQLVLLLATDPAVVPDVQAFCGATGHTLTQLEQATDVYRAWVRKAR